MLLVCVVILSSVIIVKVSDSDVVVCASVDVVSFSPVVESITSVVVAAFGAVVVKTVLVVSPIPAPLASFVVVVGSKVALVALVGAGLGFVDSVSVLGVVVVGFGVLVVGFGIVAAACVVVVETGVVVEVSVPAAAVGPKQKLKKC